MELHTDTGDVIHDPYVPLFQDSLQGPNTPQSSNSSLTEPTGDPMQNSIRPTGNDHRGVTPFSLQHTARGEVEQTQCNSAGTLRI
ncbi:hypothetical protein PAMP_007273 [Pampus punctatissimus]